MSLKTNIEWCHSTWSPWLGCRRVSPGCVNCYIAWTTPIRVRKIKHGGPRQRTSEAYWKQPLQWNKQQAERSMRENVLCPKPRIFPSLCDWLDDEVSIGWLADFLKLIHDTPNLDWLLLTKRPENFKPRLGFVLWWMANENRKPEMDIPIGKFLFDWLANKPPANVWLGVSVEDQQRADERIPVLLKTPAAIRFLSVEPLLGPVDLGFVENEGYKLNCLTGQQKDMGRPCEEIPAKIGWVIFGGESGPGARPCHVQWIRNGVVQCRAAGVDCFVKQLGADARDGSLCCHGCSHEGAHPLALKHPKGGDMSEWPEDLRLRQIPLL